MIKKYIIVLLILITLIVIENFIFKTYPFFNQGKDAGLAFIVLFHLLNSYICFLLIRRGLLSYIGLGFFIGLLSCVFHIFITSNLSINKLSWFDFLFISQLIDTAFVVIIAIAYDILIRRFERMI